MMNELLKIQQDMGAPQQHQPRREVAMRDKEDADGLADPNEWVADLQNLAFITVNTTTNHWLQVFRQL